MLRVLPLLFLSILSPRFTTSDVLDKARELLSTHAKYREYREEVAQRTLSNFLDLVDPMKVYFTTEEIYKYLDPDEEFLYELIYDYKKGHFDQFREIYEKMIDGCNRYFEISSEEKVEEEPEVILADNLWPSDMNDLRRKIAQRSFTKGSFECYG